MVKDLTDLVKFVIDLEEEIRWRNQAISSGENALNKPFSEYEILVRLSDFSGVPTEDLVSPKRTQDICDVRNAGYYLLGVRGLVLKKIGATLGGRDHSTVIHGRNVMRDYIKIYSSPEITEGTGPQGDSYSTTGNE